MKNKPTVIEKKIEEQAVVNPSYDKSLPPEERLWDYLGKLHLVLHGVVPHEPFDLTNEGKPDEMCDTSDKKELVEFVLTLIKPNKQLKLKIHRKKLIQWLEFYFEAHQNNGESINTHQMADELIDYLNEK